MSLCKRVIARLDVKGSRLIKGVRFEGVRVIGDACLAATKYASEGIDEIFYSDAVASLYGRNGLAEVLRETTKEVFVPITAGGAIRSVEDGRKLLAAGADKLAINTAGVSNPKLIKDLALRFGRQCVVVSIQARRRDNKKQWDVMIESGREKANIDLIDWIKEVQDIGAGELLITSVDKDGTGSGPDNDLIEFVMPYIDVPMIFGGGYSSTIHIQDTFSTHNKLSAIALGWSLHFQKLSIADAKQSLEKSNCLTRPIPQYRNNYTSKSKKNIGIIDYGMGNVQSLINAIEELGARPILTKEPSSIEDLDLWALPGVGSFPEGMKQLERINLIEQIKERATQGLPILGICLGMQLLFKNGYEDQFCQGLGIFPGSVERLPSKDNDGSEIPWPHVGWNTISPCRSDESFHEFSQIYQYFVHGYAVRQPAENLTNVLFESTYGQQNFISGIRKDNVIGIQFHPERSGQNGLRLLSKIIQELTL